MIDLCLQVYGSIDNLVAFCIENNVGDVNFVPQVPTEYTYNADLVTDGRTNNYTYVTAIQPNYYVTEDGSGYYVTEDGSMGYVEET